jgi:hypothetical protein
VIIEMACILRAYATLAKNSEKKIMPKFIGNLLVALALSWAGSAVAIPIIVDGKEWLQPKDFTDLSWNDINAVCPAAAGGVCSGSLNLIDVTGYTWAALDQVNALFNAIIGANVLGPGPDFANIAPAGTWFDEIVGAGFAPTLVVAFEAEYIFGLTRTTRIIGIHEYAAVGAAITGNGQDSVTTEGGLFKAETDPDYGAWFVRTASVPTPATATLMALGLAVAVFSRRKRAVHG